MSSQPAAMRVLVIGLLAACSCTHARHWQPPPRPLFHAPHRPVPTTAAGAPAHNARPGTQNCSVHYLDQRLDHFGFHEQRQFKQRYFVCTSYWKRTTSSPVFFYVGNEADVALYVNQTGLMWESAPQFGALLIFAEHRYFGNSQPFANTTDKASLNWLSTEQALADFATLLHTLKTGALPGVGPSANGSAVIGFGGSYGGMLCSWLRQKYPTAVDGIIAGSAPILSFAGIHPAYNPYAYADIETDDASSKGGVSPKCAAGVRRAWQRLFALGGTKMGVQTIQKSLRLCDPISPRDDSSATGGPDVYAVAYWAQSAFDYMATGSYPFPSSYMLNGFGTLPPYPLRVACKEFENLAEDGAVADEPLLEALRGAVNTFYNFTGSAAAKKQCFDLGSLGNAQTKEDGRLWNYLYCTEMVQPFARNGVTDMFWSQPWDFEGMASGCQAEWGTTPQQYWATVNYGGRAAVESTMSNAVYSNGALDPWHGGGLLNYNSTERSVASILIADVGHHIDLMFSSPQDPPQVTEARIFERSMIKKWVEQVSARNGHRSK